jgi:hypothetical protein
MIAASHIGCVIVAKAFGLHTMQLQYLAQIPSDITGAEQHHRNGALDDTTRMIAEKRVEERLMFTGF